MVVREKWLIDVWNVKFCLIGYCSLLFVFIGYFSQKACCQTRPYTTFDMWWALRVPHHRYPFLHGRSRHHTRTNTNKDCLSSLSGDMHTAISNKREYEEPCNRQHHGLHRRYVLHTSLTPSLIVIRPICMHLIVKDEPLTPSNIEIGPWPTHPLSCPGWEQDPGMTAWDH